MPGSDSEFQFGRLNRIGFALLRVAARLFIFPWFRLSASFEAPLPAGAMVLAPNHRSLIDPVVVQSVFPRRIVFLMTDQWYERRGLRWFFRFMRCIAVDSDSPNRAALERARAALAAGMTVAIFPEGKLSPSGHLDHFVAGVVALARRAGVPIVPVGIDGSREALPPGRGFPRPHRVTLAFGTPLPLPEAVESESGALSRKALLREDTARLRAAVARLLPVRARPLEDGAVEDSPIPS